MWNRCLKIIIFLSFCIFLLSCNILNKNKKALIENKDQIMIALNERFDYIKNLSKVLAFEPEIINTYKALYDKAGGVKEIEGQKEIILSYGQKLKEIFNEIIRRYERDIGLPMKYNFYLPKSKLWLIPDRPLGEDISLEDKSKDKPQLMDVFNKGLPIYGLTIEKEALIFSAISPIQNEKGEILGAIEAWCDLSYIIDQYLSYNSDIKILVILNQEQKKYFTEKKYKIFEKGIIYFNNFKEINDPGIIDKILNTPKNEIIKVDKNEFVVENLYDYKNSEIGKILLNFYKKGG